MKTNMTIAKKYPPTLSAAILYDIMPYINYKYKALICLVRF
jgi:hypothetical protein